MAFLVTLLGGAYILDYIEENVVNPISDKYNEIKKV